MNNSTKKVRAAENGGFADTSTDDSSKRNGSPNTFSLIGTAGVMGLHMISGPVVGGGLGWLLDSWLSTGHICAGIGAVLGFAAGFLNVWTDAKFLIQGNESADKEKTKTECKKNLNRGDAPFDRKIAEKSTIEATNQGDRASGKEIVWVAPQDGLVQRDKVSDKEDRPRKRTELLNQGDKVSDKEEEAFLLASLMAGTSFANGKSPRDNAQIDDLQAKRN